MQAHVYVEVHQGQIPRRTGLVHEQFRRVLAVYEVTCGSVCTQRGCVAFCCSSFQGRWTLVALRRAGGGRNPRVWSTHRHTSIRRPRFLSLAFLLRCENRWPVRFVCRGRVYCAIVSSAASCGLRGLATPRPGYSFALRSGQGFC